MTSQAKMATGAMVLYNGTVYAELTEVSPPSFSVEKVDATSHDSTHKISIGGQSSFGDLTFKANFVNDTSQAALRVLALAKTTGLWRFVYPASSGLPTYSVPGFISSYSTTAPLKGAPAQMSVSITPTEGVTEVTAAATALTTPFLVLTKAETGTVTAVPAASATDMVLDYTLPQATVTGYTLTPTATAGTIYVNGTIVATGQASGQIGYTLAAFPTGSIKTDFVVVDGGGKPSIYRLRMTRGTA